MGRQLPRAATDFLPQFGMPFAAGREEAFQQENVNYFRFKVLCQIKYKTNFKMQQQSLPTLNSCLASYWDVIKKKKCISVKTQGFKFIQGGMHLPL